ncbi:MAG: class I tRNA ligase family protein, partial [Kiritimatiellaeota bacterium]|nr:class I tRNA ligase family protein [Kiritimatiellota bacterium]
MFEPVSNKIDFPAMEREVLRFWDAHDTFKKSLEARKDAPRYVFYDGPPFATGLPHYGHLLAGTIKDIVPRYQTMRGNYVERRFGWDCHGLPIEALAQEALGINGAAAIREYGVGKFNEQCRSMVLRYVEEWRKTVTRMGRWVDFDNDYKTMEPSYMESIWWVMKSLWDKKLLYEGYYILPYCPRCSTVLSNHELNQGGYEDVHDPAITIRFKVNGIVPRSPAAAEPLLGTSLNEQSYILAWTTTPWTLPSNLALVLGPDIEYVLVEDIAKDGVKPARYILAKERLHAYYKNPEDYKIIWTLKGANLIGLEY